MSKLKIHQLRKKVKMSQRQLAKVFGVSTQTIMNWENQIYEPNIKQLIQIANYFEVSIDYLVGRVFVGDRFIEYVNSLERLPKEKFIELIRGLFELIDKLD